jgi:hypothetical protein
MANRAGNAPPVGRRGVGQEPFEGFAPTGPANQPPAPNGQAAAEIESSPERIDANLENRLCGSRPRKSAFAPTCLAPFTLHPLAQDRIYPAEMSVALRFKPGQDVVVNPKRDLRLKRTVVLSHHSLRPFGGRQLGDLSLI